MLALFRRHLASCKHRAKGRTHKTCACPIAVEGRLHGKQIRKSLDLRNMEAAIRLIRDWEIHGEAQTVTVTQACEKFMADAEARLKPQSVNKYKQVSEELKRAWKELPVRAISVDDVRTLRNSWKLSGSTTRKRLELVRGFFRFCLDSGWLQTNPAKAVKPTKVEARPTMPYSDKEWENILTAVDVVREIHPQMPESTQKKLRALVLLLRYSGLRISDAVTLRSDRIDAKGRLFLYTQKTGKPVYVPLPKTVLTALKQCDEGDGMYFWPGTGKLKTALTDWQERLQKVAKIAGIEGRGVAHRLRDTFSVSLLNGGVPIETVAVLLGNSVKVVEKHYAPWMESRQKVLEEAVKATW